MAVEAISLTDFRALIDTRLEFGPGFNIITGANGAGKTSLLEAIGYVLQGRSFLTTHHNELIKHGRTAAVVFVGYSGHKVGAKRTRSGTTMKLDGNIVRRLSDIVIRCPVRTLGNRGYELAIAKPAVKREFIDWSLFHVEHSYRQLWLDYRHALKQRNQILRDKIQLPLLDYWDTELVNHSNRIADLRAKYCEELSQILSLDHGNLVRELDISMSYRAGWDQEDDLAEIYKKNRDRELRFGYTLYGVQRDNIRITSQGHVVNSVLSRGQVKLLSIAMHLAQVNLVQRITGKSIVMLVDDLASEMDVIAIKSVVAELQRMDLQAFITTIDRVQLVCPPSKDYRLFHVEHGIIRAVSSS